MTAKRNQNSDSVWLGYNVKTEPGPVLRPTAVQFWKPEEFKKHTPEQPLTYHSDALLGLSLVHLNPNLQTPFTSPQMNFSFCNQAWFALEPHHELSNRCQARVRSLTEKCIKADPSVVSYFEKNFVETLDAAIHPWGVDLTHFDHLLDCIEYFENRIDKPILYNFGIQLDKKTREKLQHLHSMLFNLRTLVAVDHNAHVQDPTFEALRVDSITDYLAKAEYIANDAILYWTFLKASSSMTKPVASRLEEAFHKFSHNGKTLIDAIPKSFINNFNQEELEEALYLVQMDWLLGSDAGLLFKVREELYGLKEGYEKIFWPEYTDRPTKTSSNLTISCKIESHHIEPEHTNKGAA